MGRGWEAPLRTSQEAAGRTRSGQSVERDRARACGWAGTVRGSGRARSRFAVVQGEFDLVQTLLRLPGHGPDPGVEHHVWAIPDGPLDGTQLAGVIRLARAACDALDGGHRSSSAAITVTTARGWSSRTP